MLTPSSTEPPPNMETRFQAFAVFQKLCKVKAASIHSTKPGTCREKIPCPSQQRKMISLKERPYNLNTESSDSITQLGGGPEHPDTVFYLAYGSNLCAETFQGRRGIRPLSQANVLVPELVMTFDLAGLPYVEPCFANTKYRKPDTPLSPEEKSHPLTPKRSQYRKNRWTKGLVGVVYEVTKKDFAHIIATEGGGASYQDVLVACYELSPNDTTVPDHPTSEPFKAHTLYSPVFPPGKKPPKEGGRFSRPDPNYAQASARYLKLIKDGADEHDLPEEYKSYLRELRPYTVTTQKQRLGRWIFSMIWLPFIMAILSLNNRLANEDGKAPAWLVAIAGAVFKAMWVSYDGFFRPLFGDGERTVYDEDGGDGCYERVPLRRKERRLSIRHACKLETLDVDQAV